METILSNIRGNFSSDMIIYIAMALLVIFALVNMRGKGLFNLWRISRNLKKAAGDLRSAETARDLCSKLLAGKSDEASLFIRTRPLRRQLKLYAEEIKKNRVTSPKHCQLDIGVYFNNDLLDMEGNSNFQEHATAGLNALGILGTFLGLILGLQNFQTDTVENISESIRTLMSGMGTAFNTSLIGISLSLFFGTIYRTVYDHAEKNLDIFLEEFRRNILSDQRQSSINQVVDRLIKLENQVSLNSAEHRSEIDTMARDLVAHMGECLTEQINEMRSAVEATTAQQIVYNEKIGEMIVQLDAVSNRISQVGTSFAPVIDQSRLLAEQVSRSNREIQEEMRLISEIVSADSAIVDKQLQAVQKMDRYAGAMGVLGEKVAQQSQRTTESIDQLTQCSQSVMLDSQTALESQLRAIMLASTDLNNALMEQSVHSMEVLQQQMERMIRSLPVRSDDSRCLEALVHQNQKMIENQQRMLDAMGYIGEDHGSSSKSGRRLPRWLRRS